MAGDSPGDDDGVIRKRKGSETGQHGPLSKFLSQQRERGQGRGLPRREYQGCSGTMVEMLRKWGELKYFAELSSPSPGSHGESTPSRGRR